MSDIDNILGQSGNEEEIDSRKLMDYLNGRLSDEEQHEMERRMADSEMASDALEGLQGMGNKSSLELVAFDLNNRLKQQLQLKNDRRKKRKITSFNLTVITIVLILLLCVLGYVVIRMYNK